MCEWPGTLLAAPAVKGIPLDTTVAVAHWELEYARLHRYAPVLALSFT